MTFGCFFYRIIYKKKSEIKIILAWQYVHISFVLLLKKSSVIVPVYMYNSSVQCKLNTLNIKLYTVL